MGGLSLALEELKLADHMIYVTLPLLDDKRIFINAVNHLSKAIHMIIKQFMINETDYKRLKHLPSDDLLINEFINKYSRKLGLTVYNEMIKKIMRFNNVRQRSSIKLKKNNKFIVISPEYSMESLSIDQVKEYLNKVKDLISKVGKYI